MDTRLFPSFSSHRTAERRLCLNIVGPGEKGKIDAEEARKAAEQDTPEHKKAVEDFHKQLDELRAKIQPNAVKIQNEKSAKALEAEEKAHMETFVKFVEDNPNVLRGVDAARRQEFVKQLTDSLSADQVNRKAILDILGQMDARHLTGIANRFGNATRLEDYMSKTMSGVVENMYKNPSMSRVVKLAESMGIRQSDVRDFLVSGARGLMAYFLSTASVPEFMRNNKMVVVARTMGRELHYRDALQRRLTENGGTFTTWQNAERDMNVEKIVKDRWVNAYDQWAQRAQRINDGALRGQRIGSPPTIDQALTAEATNKYLTDLTGEDPAKKKAEADKVAADNKAEKEFNEKFMKSAVRLRSGESFADLPDTRAEVTPERPVVVEYGDGTEITFRKMSGRFEMRIGNNGAWLNVQSRAGAADAAINLTTLRIHAPNDGTGNQGSFRVIINNDETHSRNLSVLVDIARKNAALRRLVYQTTGNETHMI